MGRSRAARSHIILCCALILTLLHAVAAVGRGPAPARERKIAADTTRVALRPVPWKKIEEFRKNDDFRYDRADLVNLSIWDRIQQWLFYQLGRLFKRVDTIVVGKYLEIVIYAVVAVTVTYVILKIFSSGIQGLFFSPHRKAGSAPADFDDVDTMDIEALIERYLKSGDYRAVVRLQYIRCLRRLAAKNLVTLKRNKTNDEYLRELGDSPLCTGFGELTRIFEYTWYGNFPVSEESYTLVRDLFDGFYAGLGENP